LAQAGKRMREDKGACLGHFYLSCPFWCVTDVYKEHF